MANNQKGQTPEPRVLNLTVHMSGSSDDAVSKPRPSREQRSRDEHGTTERD